MFSFFVWFKWFKVNEKSLYLKKKGENLTGELKTIFIYNKEYDTKALYYSGLYFHNRWIINLKEKQKHGGNENQV